MALVTIDCSGHRETVESLVLDSSDVTGVVGVRPLNIKQNRKSDVFSREERVLNLVHTMPSKVAP